jgi:predicted small secreted protein
MKKIGIALVLMAAAFVATACNTEQNNVTIGADCPSIGLHGTTPQGTRAVCSPEGTWQIYWVR